MVAHLRRVAAQGRAPHPHVREREARHLGHGGPVEDVHPAGAGRPVDRATHAAAAVVAGDQQNGDVRGVFTEIVERAHHPKA